MLNPILSFSATRRMRSWKTLLIAGAYLAVMLGAALMIMGSLFAGGVSIYTLRSGVRCYQILMILQFVLILLIVLLLRQERTKQTPDGDRAPKGRDAQRRYLVRRPKLFQVVWAERVDGRFRKDVKEQSQRRQPDVRQQFQNAAHAAVRVRGGFTGLVRELRKCKTQHESRAKNARSEIKPPP